MAEALQPWEMQRLPGSSADPRAGPSVPHLPPIRTVPQGSPESCAFKVTLGGSHPAWPDGSQDCSKAGPGAWRPRYLGEGGCGHPRPRTLNPQLPHPGARAPGPTQGGATLREVAQVDAVCTAGSVIGDELEVQSPSILYQAEKPAPSPAGTSPSCVRNRPPWRDSAGQKAGSVLLIRCAETQSPVESSLPAGSWDMAS